MSSTGTTTSSSSGLRAPASTIVTSRSGPMPAEEPRDRLERPLRGATGRSAAPAARPRGAEALEPLQAEGQVRAALGAGDRVDLVDDHVLDAAQDLARLARQQQVQALRGRDEDVRRVAGRSRGGPRSGVSPVRLATLMRGAGLAETLGRQPDPGERRPQVALDVVGQGLERRDVEDPDVAGLGRASARGWDRGRAGRGTTGTRPGSCRSPSGRGSACAAPRAMAAQPSAWAWVGASKLASNQARTAGENGRERIGVDDAWPRDAEYRRAGAIWTRCSISRLDSPSTEARDGPSKTGRSARPRLRPRRRIVCAVGGALRQGMALEKGVEGRCPALAHRKVVGVIADRPLLIVVNPWFDPDDQAALATCHLGFWISFIVLLVLLFQERKAPGGETIEIEGPAFTRFLFGNSQGGPVLAADPAVRRLLVARGRLAQVHRRRLARRRRRARRLLEERRGDPGGAGRPADHLRVVSRLPQHPASTTAPRPGSPSSSRSARSRSASACILGILTGFAAFFGALMNMSFLLAGSASTNPVLFTLAIGLILAWKVAGYYGVDRWLLPMLGTPWHPAVLSGKATTPA